MSEPRISALDILEGKIEIAPVTRDRVPKTSVLVIPDISKTRLKEGVPKLSAEDIPVVNIIGPVTTTVPNASTDAIATGKTISSRAGVPKASSEVMPVVKSGPAIIGVPKASEDAMPPTITSISSSAVPNISVVGIPVKDKVRLS